MKAIRAHGARIRRTIAISHIGLRRRSIRHERRIVPTMTNPSKRVNAANAANAALNRVRSSAKAKSEHIVSSVYHGVSIPAME